MNRDQLHHIRTDYARATLDESHAPALPTDLFQRWLNEAITAKIDEPNAMTLATVGSNLRPSVRTVLIKEFSPEGIIWYTHYSSRKGQQLAGNPFAALQFHWVQLERTVRIEGRVEKVDAAQSDAYFASRPKLSQVGAWASPQSQVIAGRAELDARVAAQEARFAQADELPRPETWGGYRLVPDYWEFWQGRPSRLHDRLCYRLENNAWHMQRLAP